MGAEPRLYRRVSLAARLFGQASRIGPEVMQSLNVRRHGQGLLHCALPVRQANGFLETKTNTSKQFASGRERGWSVPRPDIGARWSWRAQEARSRIASRPPTGGRRRSIRGGAATGSGGTPHIRPQLSCIVRAMGHVPVENETITFATALRHNEMMAPRAFEGMGQERRNVLPCVAHCLGPKLRGAITFEKMVVREAWRRTSGPRSALDRV